MREADEVLVESTLLNVSISGQVKNPGPCFLSARKGLCEAVTLAGGVTDKAAGSKVTISHLDGTQETVDYAGLLESGATTRCATATSSTCRC